MLITSLTVGPLYTNCYIVACERTLEAIIIDPGFSRYDEDKVFREIKRSGFKIRYIVNTHGHTDHISGNQRIKEETGAKIAIHRNDVDMLTDLKKNLSIMLGLRVTSPPPDLILENDDRIVVGDLEIEVLHTPGHTPGSISLYSRSDGVVFTGDTLFAGSIGRTDLPGSSYEDLISSIRKKLLVLPNETIVYPGHGFATTVGRERRGNPFLLL